MALTYIAWNGAAPGAAAIPKVATGTSIKTMMQLVPGYPIKVIEWGVSFDGSAAATPGQCELIETTTVAATVTAYGVNDVMPFDGTAPANTSGSTGIPLNLGTALSGYTSTAEGTVTGATRVADTQLVAPTNQYLKQYPLSREFVVLPGKVLRVRMTFAATVNALCYVLFEL